MSIEISATELSEHRILQLIDNAVKRGFSVKELDDLEVRCKAKHKLKRRHAVKHDGEFEKKWY